MSTTVDPMPGTLAHNLPEGTSHCPACDWTGATPRHRDRLLHTCPGCDALTMASLIELIDDEESAKMRKAAGRNDPCPCGSGRKFKKCCL